MCRSDQPQPVQRIFVNHRDRNHPAHTDLGSVLACQTCMQIFWEHQNRGQQPPTEVEDLRKSAMSPDLPLVHLYAPQTPHGEAYIMGNSEAIHTLIAALMTALDHGVSQAKLSAGANNPYTIHIQAAYDYDSPIWRNRSRRSLLPWERRPASDKQRALLDRYGLSHTPSPTAGEANADLVQYLGDLGRMALSGIPARR